MVGISPRSIVSNAFVYNRVIRTFASVAYPKSVVSKLSTSGFAQRRKVILLFSLGAAPAITAFLVRLSSLRAPVSVNTNVHLESAGSSNSNINTSLIGFGLFRRFVTNPGVLYFFVVTFISYIINNFTSFSFSSLNTNSLFIFSVAWVSLFLIYTIIFLYIANSIMPPKDGTIRELNIPAYLPKFIKEQLQDLNITVHENKQKAVETQIRVVLMFVLLLLLIITMFSILFYFV